MRIAVVGAGPAGFYTCSALLKRFREAHVDLIERLPVPFGLVRYGVAPDHPSTRKVISRFSAMMSETSRLSFFGNVQVISDGDVASSDLQPALHYDQLSSLYDAVIIATGAAHPRQLPITHYSHDHSKKLFPVHAAHDFLMWLNGHPDFHTGGARQSVGDSLCRDMSRAQHLSVIGAGNVSLDVARLLLRPRHELLITEASPTALKVLEIAPPIQCINLFARCLPPFAKWTPASLREICSKVPGITVCTDMSLAAASTEQERLPLTRSQKRNLDILSRFATDSSTLQSVPDNSSVSTRFLNLMFNLSVRDISVSDEKLRIHLCSTRNPEFPFIPVKEVAHQCDVAFMSLGYESGITPPHTLAVGWANGTARGVIGDNKWDAESVVASMLPPSPICERKPGIQEWITETSHPAVSWEGWLRIDAEEARRAQAVKAPVERLRIETKAHLLKVALG